MFFGLFNYFSKSCSQLRAAKLMDLILVLGIRSRLLTERYGLWVLGLLLISSGLGGVSQAQTVDFVRVPDTEFVSATCRVLMLVEGSLGALLVTISGIIAIVSAAFGGFRASTAMVATGTLAFVLRDFIDLYFDIPREGCGTTPGSPEANLDFNRVDTGV